MSVQVVFSLESKATIGYGSLFSFVPSVPSRLFPNNEVLFLNWESIWSQ